MLRIAVCTLFAAAASAQVSYFAAALDGAQEVPPVVTNGRGWATVRFDAATNGVRIFAFHEGLSGAPTAAHLHSGAVGVAGGIVVTLAAAGPNAFTGTATLSGANATALAGGNTYVNIHTGAHSGGEIRGQVVAAASTRFTGVLSGTQEVPANASTATGTVHAYLHEPEDRLVYIVESTGLANVQAAHVHTGAAGVNGAIAFLLNANPGNGSYCGVTPRLTAAQRTALLADGMYVNVHTMAFPNGEIRAQLLRDRGDHFRAALDGAQEVPPNASPGRGSARLTVGANGVITVEGAFAGLTSPTSAAHVHVGAPGVAGGVVFALTIAGTRLSGTFTPTAANLTALRAGNWYVNVHTTAFPGGEIRGQIGPAQLATTFGEGCPGSNGTRPQIGASSAPVLASALRIDLYGGPNAPTLAVFALGANRDSSGALSLPAELTAAGLPAPRCHALVDPAATVVVFTNALGCGAVQLNVPLAASLRGVRYFGQWFVFDGPANAAGVVTSSGLTLPLQ
jgi:hypothetical protein